MAFLTFSVSILYSTLLTLVLLKGINDNNKKNDDDALNLLRAGIASLEGRLEEAMDARATALKEKKEAETTAQNLRVRLSEFEPALKAAQEKAKTLEQERAAWEAEKEVLCAKHQAQLDELRAQMLGMKNELIRLQEENRRLVDDAEALELQRAESMAKLVKSQIQVVVSSPCVRLNIGGQSDGGSTVSNAPSEVVMAEVRKVLEKDVLPKFVACFVPRPGDRQQAWMDKKTDDFVNMMAGSINEQIIDMLYDGKAEVRKGS